MNGSPRENDLILGVDNNVGTAVINGLDGEPFVVHLSVFNVPKTQDPSSKDLMRRQAFPQRLERRFFSVCEKIFAHFGVNGESRVASFVGTGYDNAATAEASAASRVRRNSSTRWLLLSTLSQLSTFQSLLRLVSIVPETFER